jgi:uncharacterized protein (TIGR04255 family)
MAFRHYKKNYLETVIFQLRFPLILKLESTSPGEYQELVHERFPNPRAGSEVNLEVLMTPDLSKAEKRSFRPRWLFFAKDEMKSVTVGSDIFSLEYRKFTDVSDAEGDFSFAWGAFRRLYQVERIDRVGVRYVDKITLPSGNPFDWSGYIQEDIMKAVVGVPALPGHDVLRSMHALHLGATDHRITFQFGIHNSDFPNPVAKRSFILDFDCCSVGPVEAADAEASVRVYNEVIHELFERSIGDLLRQDLGIVDTPGNH